MKDKIKSRFYRIDFTVEYDGDIIHIYYVEYAKSHEVLEALINKDIKDLERDNYRVMSYITEYADNDDIREYLIEDNRVSHQILVEMLDIAYNREGQ
jgi:hypothetical protein